MHVGTNHLSSETTPERIAKLIVDLIKNVKKENRSVGMSGIVPQNDTPNNKAWDVKVDQELLKIAQLEDVQRSENWLYWE